MNDTEPRVAIITGGSHGIGAGLVTAYRREGLGGDGQRPQDQAQADPSVLNGVPPACHRPGRAAAAPRWAARVPHELAHLDRDDGVGEPYYGSGEDIGRELFRLIAKASA